VSTALKPARSIQFHPERGNGEKRKTRVEIIDWKVRARLEELKLYLVRIRELPKLIPKSFCWRILDPPYEAEKEPLSR
jgi:hypothetical protein